MGMSENVKMLLKGALIKDTGKGRRFFAALSAASTEELETARDLLVARKWVYPLWLRRKNQIELRLADIAHEKKVATKPEVEPMITNQDLDNLIKRINGLSQVQRHSVYEALVFVRGSYERVLVTKGESDGTARDFAITTAAA